MRQRKMRSKAGLNWVLWVVILGLVLPLTSLFGETSKKKGIDLVEVNKVFEKFDSTHTPGMTIAVNREGRYLFKKAYGMASLELKVPNTLNSVFRIGSVSKQFTAACIALLVRDKKISLDDPLIKFFPELPRKVYSAVKVAHLLHHTSGVRDSEALYPIMGIKYSRWYTHDMMLKMLARQKALSFPPGESLEYSNSAYTLMALIVEKVTGQPFPDYVKESIFKPLGMKNTYIHTSDDTFIPNRSAGYKFGAGGYKNWMTNNQLIGHDAVYTTVHDLTQWGMALYNNSWEADVVKTMITTTTFNNGKTNPYAYGIVVSDYKGLPTLGHGGWYVGYTANIMVFPKQKLVISIMANHNRGSRARESRKLAELFLKDELAASFAVLRKKEKKVGKKFMKLLPGTWWGELYGVKLDLEIKKGKLKPTSAPSLLDHSPYFRNAFVNYKQGINLVFHLPQKFSEKKFMDLHRRMGPIERFVKGKQSKIPVKRKKKVQEKDPGNIINVQPFVGEYYSEEALNTASLQIKNKLMISVGLRQGPLSHMYGDSYTAKWGKVAFLRSTNGQVTGFKLSCYGFRNLLFLRKKKNK